MGLPLTLVDFTTDPPEGQVVLTPQVLPAGLGRFLRRGLLPRRVALFVQRGYGRPGAGAVTPATLDFTRTLPLTPEPGPACSSRCTLVPDGTVLEEVTWW